jgi:hypothetical protein
MLSSEEFKTGRSGHQMAKTLNREKTLCYWQECSSKSQSLQVINPVQGNSLFS